MRSTGAGRATTPTDVWSQLILKEPNDSVELLTEVPKTGIWRLDGASITFSRWGNDWHSLLDETEGFYLTSSPQTTTATGRRPRDPCHARRLQAEDNSSPIDTEAQDR